MRRAERCSRRPFDRQKQELLAGLEFFETHGYFPSDDPFAPEQRSAESYAWQQVRTPEELLEIVLSYIEPDGSVMIAEDEFVYTCAPRDAINLYEMHDMLLIREAIRVGEMLWNYFRNLHDVVTREYPHLYEHSLRSLAHYLTAYRDNRAFLVVAASLVYSDFHTSNRPSYTRPVIPLEEDERLMLRTALRASLQK